MLFPTSALLALALASRAFAAPVAQLVIPGITDPASVAASRSHDSLTVNLQSYEQVDEFQRSSETETDTVFEPRSLALPGSSELDVEKVETGGLQIAEPEILLPSNSLEPVREIDEENLFVGGDEHHLWDGPNALVRAINAKLAHAASLAGIGAGGSVPVGIPIAGKVELPRFESGDVADDGETTGRVFPIDQEVIGAAVVPLPGQKPTVAAPEAGSLGHTVGSPRAPQPVLPVPEGHVDTVSQTQFQVVPAASPTVAAPLESDPSIGAVPLQSEPSSSAEAEPSLVPTLSHEDIDYINSKAGQVFTFIDVDAPHVGLGPYIDPPIQVILPEGDYEESVFDSVPKTMEERVQGYTTIPFSIPSHVPIAPGSGGYASGAPVHTGLTIPSHVPIAPASGGYASGAPTHTGLTIPSHVPIAPGSGGYASGAPPRPMPAPIPISGLPYGPSGIVDFGGDFGYSNGYNPIIRPLPTTLVTSTRGLLTVPSGVHIAPGSGGYLSGAPVHTGLTIPSRVPIAPGSGGYASGAPLHPKVPYQPFDPLLVPGYAAVPPLQPYPAQIPPSSTRSYPWISLPTSDLPPRGPGIGGVVFPTYDPAEDSDDEASPSSTSPFDDDSDSDSDWDEDNEEEPFKSLFKDFSPDVYEKFQSFMNDEDDDDVEVEDEADEEGEYDPENEPDPRYIDKDGIIKSPNFPTGYPAAWVTKTPTGDLVHGMATYTTDGTLQFGNGTLYTDPEYDHTPQAVLDYHKQPVVTKADLRLKELDAQRRRYMGLPEAEERAPEPNGFGKGYEPGPVTMANGRVYWPQPSPYLPVPVGEGYEVDTSALGAKRVVDARLSGKNVEAGAVEAGLVTPSVTMANMGWGEPDVELAFDTQATDTADLTTKLGGALSWFEEPSGGEVEENIVVPETRGRKGPKYYIPRKVMRELKVAVLGAIDGVLGHY
ncbi:hypothetical protein BJ508DRAFT_315492 [Ascobolus immersus RN42]|uniref:Uncharacterized protein n=1 Tax=Ascobolus immersus RN42 TaxID=1160509 RepID=A0A3N4HEE6_ASCIM|nr:hypothetical protein BJ508DRAFT_315492 [Ascobolus immersus RN42]